jgi:hypothetical protein
MGPRVDLDVSKRKYLLLLGFEPRTVQPVAYSLHWDIPAVTSRSNSKINFGAPTKWSPELTMQIEQWKEFCVRITGQNVIYNQILGGGGERWGPIQPHRLRKLLSQLCQIVTGCRGTIKFVKVYKIKSNEVVTVSTAQQDGRSRCSCDVIEFFGNRLPISCLVQQPTGFRVPFRTKVFRFMP